jgi:hypothetical protein
VDSFHQSISIQEALELIEQSIEDSKRTLVETRFISIETHREMFGALKAKEELRNAFTDLAERLSKED